MEGNREIQRSRGERKTRPPASEKSRKFVGYINEVWKIIAGLLYEDPQTLKHSVL